MAGKSRSWCFTIHFDTKEIAIAFSNDQLKTTMEKCADYAIFQIEKAPTTGAIHIQGYCHFKNARSLSGVKKLLTRETHLEVAKGTAKQNRDYCMKTDSRLEGTVPTEIGEMPLQGERMDLIKAGKDFMDGKSKSWMAENHTAAVMRYGAGLERVRQWYDEKLERTKPVKAFFLWGETGVGKTKWVYDTFGKENVYRVIDGKHKYWWDGYDNRQHKCVLFDEIGGEHSLTDVLRFIDQYTENGEVKGGRVRLLFEYAVFTSNIPLGKLWIHEDQARRDAFVRRCVCIHNVTKDSPPPKVDILTIDGLSADKPSQKSDTIGTEVSEGNTVPHSPSENAEKNTEEDIDMDALLECLGAN